MSYALGLGAGRPRPDAIVRVLRLHPADRRRGKLDFSPPLPPVAIGHGIYDPIISVEFGRAARAHARGSGRRAALPRVPARPHARPELPRGGGSVAPKGWNLIRRSRIRFQNFRTRCDCTRSAQAPLRDAPNACRHLPRRRALDRRGADLQGRQGLTTRACAILADLVRAEFLECHQFCFMPTHYHLVGTFADEMLTPAIRRLNRRYAGWFNWRHGRRGHVFDAPFVSVEVTTRAARRPATGVHRREPAFSAMAVEQRRPGVPVRYTVAVGRRAGIWFGYAESDSGLGGSRPFARSSSSADSVFSGESPIAART